MMNSVAIGLLVAWLAFSGIMMPSPQSPVAQNPNERGGEEDDQVIVKGGHRAVLVEYADSAGQGNTRVSISPPSGPGLGDAQDMLSAATAAVAGVTEDVKEKLKDAVLSVVAPNGHERHPAGTRELICDSFGKCKHKIASAMSRAKEKVVETVHGVEEETKEVVSDAVGKAKEVEDNAKHAPEVLAEKSKRTGEEVASDLSTAANNAAEKAREVAEEVAETVKEKAKVAQEVFVEKPKRKGEEMCDEVAGVARKAEEKAGSTVELVKKKGRKGKKELSDIARRAKEVFCDAVCYLMSQESVESLMGVVHLLGFAAAYGTSIWVTFVMSYVLAESLPMQQFAMVQSKIYPVYFKGMAISVGVGFLGFLLGLRSRAFSQRPEMFQACNLLASLALVLINLLFLEPRATKVMFDKMKVEKEEGRGRESIGQPTRPMETSGNETPSPAPGTADTGTRAPGQAFTREQEEAKEKLKALNNRLKKLNMYSSLLNLMTVMGLSWHHVYLSQWLQVSSR